MCRLVNVLEQSVKRAILLTLDQDGGFSDQQRGFIQNRYCLSNLLVARLAWRSALASNTLIDLAYLDFVKVFYSVR